MRYLPSLRIVAILLLLGPAGALAAPARGGPRGPGGSPPERVPGIIPPEVRQRTRNLLRRERKKIEKVFDGRPSAALQNFDLESILEGQEGAEYTDRKGRYYRGAAPGSFDHPETGTVRRLGIAFATPVLTPIVSSYAYFSRKYSQESDGGLRPARSFGGKLLNALLTVFNAAFRVFTGLVFVPFVAAAHSLTVGVGERLFKTVAGAFDKYRPLL